MLQIGMYVGSGVAPVFASHVLTAEEIFARMEYRCHNRDFALLFF